MNINKLATRMHITKADDEGNVDFIRNRAARELGGQLIELLLQDGAAFIEVTAAIGEEDFLTGGMGAFYRLEAKIVTGDRRG